MLNKAFVYGSLKEGEWNDRKYYSDNRISCEKGTIVGRIYAVASYPGVRLTGDGVVHGEVHTYPAEIAEDIVQAMDGLEGYREGREKYNHYNRRVVTVTLEDGSEVEAYVYEFGREVPAEIEILSGEWKNGMNPDSVRVRQKSASAD